MYAVVIIDPTRNVSSNGILPPILKSTVPVIANSEASLA